MREFSVVLTTPSTYHNSIHDQNNINIITVIVTSSQSIWQKRLHCRSTWMVEWYLPGGASVHSTIFGPPVYIPTGISIDSAAFCTAAEHGRFNRIRQAALMCPAPCNTWFLGPTRVHNPNSIGSEIFSQLIVECRRACRGTYFPLKIAPSLGAIWTHI